MPGPSPWPFFAPIALMVIFYGVIFSPALLVGGVSWASSRPPAGCSTPATSTRRLKRWACRAAHARPARRLAAPPGAIYAGVVAVSLFIRAAAGTWPVRGRPCPGVTRCLTGGRSRPARHFRQQRGFVRHNKLVVPAGRAFDLVFNNNNDGVPHNVEIADGPTRRRSSLPASRSRA
jgi:hypothetical protein